MEEEDMVWLEWVVEQMKVEEEVDELGWPGEDKLDDLFSLRSSIFPSKECNKHLELSPYNDFVVLLFLSSDRQDTLFVSRSFQRLHLSPNPHSSMHQLECLKCDTKIFLSFY